MGREPISRPSRTVSLGLALWAVLTLSAAAAGQVPNLASAPWGDAPITSAALSDSPEQAGKPATPAAPAQSPATPAPQPQVSPLGWQGFVQLQWGAGRIGTVEPNGTFGGAFASVIIADVDLGYGLTDHITADVGLPVIFTRSPFSPVTNHDYYWSTLLGEPYVDVRYSGTHNEINYTSILTGTIPAASDAEVRIYSTGRFGVDWFNHVDKHYGNITPFLNFGLSNGVVNRFIIPRPYFTARPYQTLGFLLDAEVGGEYKFHKNSGLTQGIGIGASYYVLEPGGPQKVFSRYVLPYSSLAGSGVHNQYFAATFQTTGNDKISRDNGYTGTLDITRFQNVDIQLAYTHSVHYHMDIYTAMFNFDTGQLIRSIMPHRH